jgi:excisionase family DNA binding protein
MLASYEKSSILDNRTTATKCNSPRNSANREEIQMAPIEDGLPTAEVAKRLGISEATVRNMRKDGRLKGFRPSGKGPIRFPESEVVRHQIETGQLVPAEAA